jgi:signal recognition particle GTPase
MSKISPGQKYKILCEKLLKLKRGGDVAQVVEHFPTKNEALNSNHCTTKRKKEDYWSPIVLSMNPKNTTNNNHLKTLSYRFWKVQYKLLASIIP